MHYYLGDKKTEELSHQIKLYISKDATATQVANDLARTENVYLGEKVIPRKKLEDLIEMIISNMNKPTGKFMLLSNSKAQEEGKIEHSRIIITNLGSENKGQNGILIYE